MDRERPSFYDDLVHRGVSRQDIDRVYRDLRERGYGAAEARRRTREAIVRARPRPDGAERRSETEPPAAGAKSPRPEGVQPSAMRRAGDWVPEVPARLRRRINRWAFRNGYLVTRLRERFDDFVSIFDQRRGDCVSRAFLRAIAGRSSPWNPFASSLVEALESIADASQLLLGRRDARQLPDRQVARRLAEEVRTSLAAREPFAIVFLGELAEPREMLLGSLDHLGAALAARRRVEVSSLARVVRDGCRLAAVTGAIEEAALERLLAVAREVNLAHDHGSRAAETVDEAVAVFRVAHANLRRYEHELYPLLLKMIASFYPESDTGGEKRQRILSFLELRESDILTWEGWSRQEQERRERLLAEQRQRELERLEQEKAASVSYRFEGTLAALEALFPGSGIERMEQGDYALPYFANRVFGRSPLVRGREQDLELLAAGDAMSVIVILHAMIDDLLSSLDPWPLESLLAREDLGERFARLREEWVGVDARLFGPYLDEVREWARELAGDPRSAARFHDSARARSIEERANRLRGRAIRNWGHLVQGKPDQEGPRLYESARELAALLAEVSEALSRERVAHTDPVSQRLAAELAKARLVNFSARSRTDSPDYKPMVRQLRRWTEARSGAPVEAVPVAAQLDYLEVFRGLAELYAYLLNDRASFLVHSGHAVVVAGEAEREQWRRERLERGRDALALMEERLKEEVAARYVDALTGLRTKEFFLSELPGRLERMHAHKRPVTFLMIDVDHFKWVNDTLGHPAGDEALAAAARSVLDNMRQGDLAIRYGGEEILVVVPGTLHTGTVLAERLRFVQERSLRTAPALKGVAEIGEGRGEPCGTLSIGVAECTGGCDAAKTVERADRALYEAKSARNRVVFLDHARGDRPESYEEYRRRLRAG